MISRPVIFVSAVGQELSGARDLVAATLTGLGYAPQWQESAPAETGALRRRVDDSAAVVQLLGHAYGDELPEPDAEFGRVSCTQYEALYARRHGKQVWYLSLARGHPIEPDAPAEPDELRKLQEAYRQQVLRASLCFDSANLEQTKEIILKLPGRLPKVRRAWKQSVALPALLLALSAFGVWRGQREEATFRQQDLAAEQALAVEEATAAQPETAPAAGQQKAAPAADLPAQLGRVQEALSRLQQNADPKNDPTGQWPPQRLEQELAGQLQIKVSELRGILDAGQTSLDVLLQGQALLASGKAKEAEAKFDAILQQKKEEKKRLRQAYAGKAQIAFAAAKYEEALQFREKAAALFDKAADPLGWASAQFSVAYLDWLLARYPQAEPLLREVVRLRAELLGPGHRDFAEAESLLGDLSLDTNRLAEAERMMKQVLTSYEKLYGPEHPRVAIALRKLAVLYHRTSRFAESESLVLRALKIDEASLGPNDPSVAVSLGNLAQVYLDTNRVAEAEPLLLRALQIDERKYGPEHPTITTLLVSLGHVYKLTNRAAEAEPLLVRALKIDATAFGPEHPKVATDLNNLAQLYMVTNRLMEAEPLMERALTIDEKTFGPNHPKIATRLNNLAQVYQSMKRRAEAEPLMVRALAINEQSYGPDHFLVATCLHNLAVLYQATNRLAEAEPRSRRAVVIQMKCSRAAGHTVGDFRASVIDYQSILRQMTVPEAGITARFAELGREAGLTQAEAEALLAPFLSRSKLR